MAPILEPPVDLAKYPVTHDFWVDESNNPEYQGFYTVFDNHHPGVDFNLSEGTSIQAALAGIVVRKELHPGMGNVLATRQANIYVLYVHLSQIQVNLGENVPAGQKIALSGNTGQATTRPHLHFELRDLIKTELKDSVFEPVFGQPIDRYVPEFSYIVNNTNSQKTFIILAIRYFGLPSYASFLRDHNPQFADLSFDSPLPGGVSILIPSPEVTVH